MIHDKSRHEDHPSCVQEADKTTSICIQPQCVATGNTVHILLVAQQKSKHTRNLRLPCFHSNRQMHLDSIESQMRQTSPGIVRTRWCARNERESLTQDLHEQYIHGDEYQKKQRLELKALKENSHQNQLSLR